MSIAVFGGNGFLGRKICEYGIKNGFKVTSFSKSGSQPIANSFLDKVKWESADIFNDDSYKKQLGQYSTVFHCIGKMFEDESYKTNLNSKTMDLGQIKRAIFGTNPMNKTYENSHFGVNKESVLTLAKNYYKAKNDGQLVYISAEDNKMPFIPKEYFESKRQAEYELLKLKLNTLIVRPGIMYDEHDTNNNRYRVVKGMEQIYRMKQGIIGDDWRCINDVIKPVISTDKVVEGIFKNLKEKDSIISLEKLMNGERGH